MFIIKTSIVRRKGKPTSVIASNGLHKAYYTYDEDFSEDYNRDSAASSFATIHCSGGTVGMDVPYNTRYALELIPCTVFGSDDKHYAVATVAYFNHRHEVAICEARRIRVYMSSSSAEALVQAEIDKRNPSKVSTV